jgi:hypothetical protein
MNDAVQIRRYSAAPRAKHSRVRPAFLAPPLTRLPNPRISNREKAASFFGPSRGGSFLSDPPAFRPRLPHRVPPQEIEAQQMSNFRNSNRESLRLETVVTPTKQTTRHRSNRELEALFFGPTRGGCISPPAFRPRLPHRVPPPEIEAQQVSNFKNSNRESLRLEIHLTQRKQTIGHRSNREEEALLQVGRNPRISNWENDAPSQSMNPAHPAAHLTGL